MREALLYLLLFAYSTVIFRPVLPTISDTIAHFFWYSEHMATVHYEHGKYHVHLESAEAAKESYPEKNNTLKDDVFVTLHLSLAQVYDFTLSPVAPHRYILTAASLPLVYQTATYPPPKAG